MLNKVIINGINIYTKGNFKKNALVFIHGNSLNALSFKYQFDDLKDVPMLALDLPGHGLSKRPESFEEIYCLPGYIKALKAIINELELKDFILVGHSLGGHIAIEAATELEAVKGVLIFGTPPIGMPPEMEKMFLPNPAMGYLYAKDISKDNALLLAKEFTYTNTAIVNEIAEMILVTDGNARVNLGGSIGLGKFKNEKEIVKSSNVPIAVFHGEKDSFVNYDYITQTQITKLWNNKTNLIHNAGHIPQMEQPSAFNSLLLEFYSHVFK